MGDIDNNIDYKQIETNQISEDEAINESDSIQQQLDYDDINPNKSELSSMKKRIISQRHMVTKSLFTASTPPPNRRLPSIHKKTATTIFVSKSSQNSPISPISSKSRQDTGSPFANAVNHSSNKYEIKSKTPHGRGKQFGFEPISEHYDMMESIAPSIVQSVSATTPTPKLESDENDSFDEAEIQFEHQPNLQTEFRKNAKLFGSQPNIRYNYKPKNRGMSDAVFGNNKQRNKQRYKSNNEMSFKSNAKMQKQGIHASHPSNRKKKNGSMTNLKQRFAMKMKLENQNNNVEKDKKERSESLDIRQIRKRKTKRKVRENIFETANSLQTNEQKQKYDPETKQNIKYQIHVNHHQNMQRNH